MTFILLRVYSGGYHALNGRVLSGFVIICSREINSLQKIDLKCKKTTFG